MCLRLWGKKNKHEIPQTHIGKVWVFLSPFTPKGHTYWGTLQHSTTHTHTHADTVSQWLAVSLSSGLVCPCMIREWQYSVHWLVSFQAWFSLTSKSPTNPKGCFHHRAQCVPVQALRGTASRHAWAPWASTQYWNWHRHWQHIIPLPENESWPGSG